MSSRDFFYISVRDGRLESHFWGCLAAHQPDEKINYTITRDAQRAMGMNEPDLLPWFERRT